LVTTIGCHNPPPPPPSTPLPPPPPAPPRLRGSWGPPTPLAALTPFSSTSPFLKTGSLPHPSPPPPFVGHGSASPFFFDQACLHPPFPTRGHNFTHPPTSTPPPPPTQAPNTVPPELPPPPPSVPPPPGSASTHAILDAVISFLSFVVSFYFASCAFHIPLVSSFRRLLGSPLLPHDSAIFLSPSFMEFFSWYLWYPLVILPFCLFFSFSTLYLCWAVFSFSRSRFCFACLLFAPLCCFPLIKTKLFSPLVDRRHFGQFCRVFWPPAKPFKSFSCSPGFRFAVSSVFPAFFFFSLFFGFPSVFFPLFLSCFQNPRFFLPRRSFFLSFYFFCCFCVVIFVCLFFFFMSEGIPLLFFFLMVPDG